LGFTLPRGSKFMVNLISRTAQERFFDDVEAKSTLKPEHGALRHLVVIAEQGETPNFLDIFAALSEIVAFYTDCDLPQIELVENICEMSVKKCLFCS